MSNKYEHVKFRISRCKMCYNISKNIKKKGEDGFANFGDWETHSGRLEYRTTPIVYIQGKSVDTIKNATTTTNFEHNFTKRHCCKFEDLFGGLSKQK